MGRGELEDRGLEPHNLQKKENIIEKKNLWKRMATHLTRINVIVNSAS